jgi:hypothetical protein
LAANLKNDSAQQYGLLAFIVLNLHDFIKNILSCASIGHERCILDASSFKTCDAACATRALYRLEPSAGAGTGDYKQQKCNFTGAA